MSKACCQRLQKEYKSLLREPVPSIKAHPSPTNLLEWHYVLEGSPGTDFEGGVYHGKVVFPAQYPYQPPSIQMLTPSGRFATKTKLCLSMTDFHPEDLSPKDGFVICGLSGWDMSLASILEQILHLHNRGDLVGGEHILDAPLFLSWNPLWSVGTILSGLLSFMYDNAHTTGSISSTKQDKRRLAAASLDYNLRNSTFRKLFPEYIEERERRILEEEQRARARAQNAALSSMSAYPSSSSSLGTLAIVAVVLAIVAIPFLSQDLTASA